MTLAVRVEEQELDELAIKLFTKHESQFTPLHPWVLVRVLPREQRVGQIWLPDNKSLNKPVHEGIVLKTWEPYTTIKYRKRERQSIVCADEIVTLHKSEFVPSDHVVYPHFAGMPVPGWDERYYRVVPETVKKERGIDWNGIILGKLNYLRESVRNRLMKSIQDTSDESFYMMVDAILEQFDVIPKDLESKTLSGR